jgi:hypothetical protein
MRKLLHERRGRLAAKALTQEKGIEPGAEASTAERQHIAAITSSAAIRPINSSLDMTIAPASRLSNGTPGISLVKAKKATTGQGTEV